MIDIQLTVLKLLIVFYYFTEEIFQSHKAVWGSPDGDLLLYATFNDTNVGTMVYPWFSSNSFIQAGGLTSRGSFPAQKTQRYPTPGTINPEVTLWLLNITDIGNLTDHQKHWIRPPISLEGQ